MERNKLKKFVLSLPQGVIITQNYLDKNGIYRQLSHHAVKSGWLENIGKGAYKKLGDNLDWGAGVFALQQNEYFPIHVGGLTSLELQGQSHFIPLGKSIVQLFNTKEGKAKRLLPKWLITYFDNVDFKFFRYRLLTLELGIISYDCSNFKIKISSTERALLEVLSLIPNDMTLEHAYLLIQNKYNLRVDLMQELLESCTSQQTNRLFLHLAKRCDLPCFKSLNINKINLGKGKRVIEGGGEYDSEFKLDLPTIRSDDKNIEVKF